MAKDKLPRGKKALSPVRPNIGIQNRYDAQLQKLVDEMAASVLWWIRAEYRKSESRIVFDASPAETLQRAMNELARRWQSRFDKLAEYMADGMISRTASNVDAGMKMAFRKAGLTVKMKMTRPLRDVLEASIAENVSLIQSIPQQYLTQIEGHVMRSITQGFRMDRLVQDLEKQRGITKRRANIIARDQSRKAHAAIQRSRQLDLGITEGVWLHSGGGKVPRQSHKAFSGKVFDITKGHDFGDGFGPVLPAESPNCRCVWKIVV